MKKIQQEQYEEHLIPTAAPAQSKHDLDKQQDLSEKVNKDQADDTSKEEDKKEDEEKKITSSEWDDENWDYDQDDDDEYDDEYYDEDEGNYINGKDQDDVDVWLKNNVDDKKGIF